jgi:hypothetical protein
MVCECIEVGVIVGGWERPLSIVLYAQRHARWWSAEPLQGCERVFIPHRVK